MPHICLNFRLTQTVKLLPLIISGAGASLTCPNGHEWPRRREFAFEEVSAAERHLHTGRHLWRNQLLADAMTCAGGQSPFLPCGDRSGCCPEGSGRPVVTTTP